MKNNYNSTTAQNSYNKKTTKPLKRIFTYGVPKKQNKVEDILHDTIRNVENQVLNTGKDQAAGENKKVVEMQNKGTNSPKSVKLNELQKPNEEVKDRLFEPIINVENKVLNTVKDQTGANMKVMEMQNKGMGSPKSVVFNGLRKRNNVKLDSNDFYINQENHNFNTNKDQAGENRKVVNYTYTNTIQPKKIAEKKNFNIYNEETDDSSSYLEIKSDVAEEKYKLTNNDISSPVHLLELNQAIENTKTGEVNNLNFINNEIADNNANNIIKNSQPNIFSNYPNLVDTPMSQYESDNTNFINEEKLKKSIFNKKILSSDECEINNSDETNNKNSNDNDNTKVENQKVITISNNSNDLIVENTKSIYFSFKNMSNDNSKDLKSTHSVLVQPKFYFKNNQKKFTVVFGLILIMVVIIGIFVYFKKRNNNEKNN